MQYFIVVDPQTGNALEVDSSIDKITIKFPKVKLTKAEYDLMMACRGDAAKGVKVLSSLQKRVATERSLNGK